jgi:hypothetical protein
MAARRVWPSFTGVDLVRQVLTRRRRSCADGTKVISGRRVETCPTGHGSVDEKRSPFDILGLCSLLSSQYRACSARPVIANNVHCERWTKQSSVMPNVSKASASKAPTLAAPNVLPIEVPPQFIALYHATGVTPQAALRGLAAMVCGLRLALRRTQSPCAAGRPQLPPQRMTTTAMGAVPAALIIALPITGSGLLR